MSGKYYRLKKYRQFKKEKDNEPHCDIREHPGNVVTTSDAGGSEKNFSENDVQNNSDDVCSRIIDNIEHEIDVGVEKDASVNSDANSVNENSNDSTSSSVISQGVESDIGLVNKLRQWGLNHLDTLRLNVVTDLLTILRSEGFLECPKTAQVLFDTKHQRILQQMQSAKGTAGEFIYLGIKNGLQRVISKEYSDNEIVIQVHVDGMQLFKNSQMQIWPIAIKVFHKNYVTKPFVAVIFSGDSKP